MNTQRSLLIVEDEAKISSLLSEYFENQGFCVTCLDHGDAVLPLLAKKQVDLILLDIMLPGMDGRTILKKIRVSSSVPVILLTARVSEADILQGLGLGADDYICKPFSPREVVARVHTVLRRTRKTGFARQIHIQPLSLNLLSHEVRIKDQVLPVTPNEYGILKTLMLEPDRTFSREELVYQVQGYEFEGYHRTIDTHIKNLRKKISALVPHEKVILSVYGKGYKINPNIF